MVTPAPPQAPGAAEFMRSVGLRVDGPAVWGAPVRSVRPGVYLVELPSPLPHAPIDMSAVGRWIERVPTLMLDGNRPAGKELAARLGGFWLPDQTVLYVGMASGSIGGRVAALYATQLGDPRPHAGGHWLRTLRGIDQMRVWWAETDAAEEYADALLSAFAEHEDLALVERLYDPTVVVPFANLQTATGLRRDHGISGALLPDDRAPRTTAKTVVTLPHEASRNAAPAAPRARAAGTGRARASRSTAPASLANGQPAVADRTSVANGSAARATPESGGGRPAPEPTHLTAAGLVALQAELAELTTVRRPEIVARIKAARELGDLSENADYEAARKDQSFLEGRIRTIGDMLRNVVIVEESQGGDEVVVGSTVVVETDGMEETYTIVGSAESNPREGRLSFSSPIGAALLRRSVGDEVVVHAPRGDIRYRIVEIR